jgi:hypothetical protein
MSTVKSDTGFVRSGRTLYETYLVVRLLAAVGITILSSRLKAILEMRRLAPSGQELPPTAYVFGNAVGEPVKSVKRAWERVVLKAHGYPLVMS